MSSYATASDHDSHGEHLMRSATDATLLKFGERDRLKVRRDYRDLFIPGKFGQVYGYESGRLAILFLGRSKRHWHAARKKLVAAGFQTMQDADTEGSALFDPGNTEQCRVAIRVIRAKSRRIPSAAQLEHLRVAREKAALSRNRKKVCARGGLGEDFESPATGTAPGSSPPESRPLKP